MKKKILLAVMCIILSATFLCSCSSSFVKEAEKNPTETVLNSLKASTESVASEGAVLDTVVPALNKGTISVKVPYEEMNVDATIYQDAEAGKAALVFSAEPFEGYASVVPNFGVYANKSELMLKCEPLLSEAVYGVDFKTLYDDLSNWSLWDDLGVDFEAFDEEYGEQVKALFDYIADPKKMDEINKKELINFVKKLDECVSVVEETDKDGVKAVVVTYDFKTEDINNVVDTLFNWSKQYYEKFVPGFKELAEDENFSAEEFFKSNYVKDYNVSVSVYLNEEDKDIMKVDVSGNYTESWPVYDEAFFENEDAEIKFDDEPYEYSVVCDFGTGLAKTDKCDFTISLAENVGIEGEEEKETVSASFIKNDSEDKLEYKLSATNGEETVEVNFLVNKKDKTFEFTGSEDSDIRSISGTYNKDDNSLVVTFKSIMAYNYFREEVYDELEGVGEFEITFTKDGKVDFPKSYTKVTDLTMEDLQEIALVVADSPVLNPMYNYNESYDDEYYEDEYWEEDWEYVNEF